MNLGIKKFLDKPYSGFVLAPLVVIGLALLLFGVLFVPVELSNYTNKDLGSELNGKYFVVTRPQLLDEDGTVKWEEMYSLYQGNDYRVFVPGEVVRINSSEYENYFEDQKITFDVSLPCEGEASYNLRIHPSDFKEKTSYVQNAFTEISATEAESRCTQ